MIILALVATLIVVGVVVYNHMYESQFFAKEKMKELAKIYYEKTIYPKITTGTTEAQQKESFKNLNKQEQRTKLSHLLNDEFLKNGNDYRNYFDTDKFTCDTNKSYVVYTANEPYGINDYSFEITLNCTKK